MYFLLVNSITDRNICFIRELFVITVLFVLRQINLPALCIINTSEL